MVNPFIDDYAYESDDEYDAGIAPGLGGGQEGGSDGMYTTS